MEKRQTLFCEDRGQRLICEVEYMPSMCHPAYSCTPCSESGRHVCNSGRQLWCQFSLIRGLFSDLMPGQAWKEVTFSKVCLKGDDMWMCWHGAPLHHHHNHHSARRAIVLVFFSLGFSSYSPRCSTLPEKIQSLFVLMLVPIRGFSLKYQFGALVGNLELCSC